MLKIYFCEAKKKVDSFQLEVRITNLLFDPWYVGIPFNLHKVIQLLEYYLHNFIKHL